MRRYSELSHRIKEPQTHIYCLNFFKKNDTIWKLRLCFIPKVTCSVLSVGALSVSSLLHDVFFTAWCVAWERHGLSDVATVTKRAGGGGGLFGEHQYFVRECKCFEIFLYFFFHHHGHVGPPHEGMQMINLIYACLFLWYFRNPST